MKITVTLPDGTTQIRRTKRKYAYAIAVRITRPDRKKYPWFAEFCSTELGAQRRIKYYANCPATKQGYKFETKIIALDPASL